MEYRGEESKPMVRMLVRLHHELTAIGIDARWNDRGVVCALPVKRFGRRFIVSRQFEAEAARLIVTTTLRTVEPLTAGGDRSSSQADRARSQADATLATEPQTEISFTQTVEVLVQDLDGIFIGCLLDRTTKTALDLAAEQGLFDDGHGRSA